MTTETNPMRSWTVWSMPLGPEDRLAGYQVFAGTQADALRYHAAHRGTNTSRAYVVHDQTEAALYATSSV